MARTLQRFDSFQPAAILALTCGAAWWIKMGVIAGLGEDSPIVDVFYLLGLATLVLAGGAIAWTSLRGRASWIRGLAAIVGAFLAWMLHQVMDAVGDAIVPGNGWFQEESSVWLTASLALVAGAGLLALARRPTGSASA